MYDDGTTTGSTSSGATLVQDLFPGSPFDSGKPKSLTVYNDNLYFSAEDGIHGTELMVYSSTTGLATLAQDINSGRTSNLTLGLLEGASDDHATTNFKMPVLGVLGDIRDGNGFSKESKDGNALHLKRAK